MRVREDASLMLRRATEDDAQLLFEWRNDPVTRENSVNQAQVNWTTHVHWLSGALKDQNREILIAEKNGNPVGMARLDYSGDLCELSWSVAAAWRHKGLGKEIVRQALALVRDATPVARIKSQNEVSTKIARSLGFVSIEQHDGLVTWRGPSPPAG